MSAKPKKTTTPNNSLSALVASLNGRPKSPTSAMSFWLQPTFPKLCVDEETGEKYILDYSPTYKQYRDMLIGDAISKMSGSKSGGKS